MCDNRILKNKKKGVDALDKIINMWYNIIDKE